jgi:hypothetical protein
VVAPTLPPAAGTGSKPRLAIALENLLERIGIGMYRRRRLPRFLPSKAVLDA